MQPPDAMIRVQHPKCHATCPAWNVSSASSVPWNVSSASSVPFTQLWREWGRECREGQAGHEKAQAAWVERLMGQTLGPLSPWRRGHACIFMALLSSPERRGLTAGHKGRLRDA